MAARPFTLLAGSVLAAAQANLAAAAARWAADWGVDAAAATVLATRASDVGAASQPPRALWRQRRTDGAGAIWLAWRADVAGELQRMLFAPDAGYAPQAQAAGTLAAAGAARALADLLDRLCRAAMPACVNPPSDTSSEPPGASWARGAGGVSVQLKLGKSGCRLLLDDSCVRAFALRMPAVAAPPAPLAPVDLAQVVDKVPVALRLSIGGARVGVGALMRLAEGDVIRLDTPIDAPVGLLAPSGVAVCNGYLGRVGDRIAVEVLAPV